MINAIIFEILSINASAIVVKVHSYLGYNDNVTCIKSNINILNGAQ